MSDKPSPEDARLWQKRLASQANNRAWALTEAAERSAEQDEEMLQASHAAMYFWSIVGDDRQKAHAAQLLAHAYAHLGLAHPAQHYFGKAQMVFSAQPGDGWERALNAAVAANVAAAAGDRAAHARHLQDAQRLTAELADDEARDIVNATVQAVRQPKGA